ncbi:MAG: AAA family ATPase [Bdellovibrionota bacterium]
MGLLATLEEHRQILEPLKQDFSKNPVGRSYLFTGPAGIGKKNSAQALAQFLLCQKYPHVCGVCGSCLRVERSAHEALLIVEPTQLQIRIEEARHILDFLSLQSLCRFRVIIINEAHRMNAAAANSLLKILEEPPADSFFFLVSSSPSRMPSTLRSRSLRVHFKPGSLRKPRDHDGEEIKQWSEELVRFLCEPDLLAQTGWRDHLKDREGFAHRLSFWMELIRDTLVLQNSSSGKTDFLLHKNLPAILTQLKTLSPEKLLAAFDLLLAFERDLAFNRDPVLMSEEFIVEMKSHSMVN